MMQLSWLVATFLLVGAAVGQPEWKMRYGQSATLRCDVGTYRPAFKAIVAIKWYKGSREIGHGDKYTIPKAVVEDSGNYTCVYVAKFNGKSIRRSQSVLVYISPQGLPDLLPASAVQVETEFNIGGGAEETFDPTIIIKDIQTKREITSLNIVETAKVHLICEVTGIFVDPIEIYWESPLGKRVSETAILFLRNVKMVEHSGRFRCIVTRTSDGATKSKDLNVIISPFQVTVIAMPGHQSTVGQTTMLKCSVDALGSDEMWEYVWTDPNGRQVGTSPLLQMLITAATRSGPYKCSAKGRNSGVSRTNNISFQVAGSRELSVGSTITVHIGDRKEFHCEPTVNGKDVMWYKDGRLIRREDLPGMNAFRQDNLRVSILRLNSIKLTDKGTYTCMVRGVTKKTFRLLIHRDDTISLDINPKVQKLIVGESAEIHCKFEARRVTLTSEDIAWHFESRGGNRRVPVDFRRWRRLPSGGGVSFFIELSNTQLFDDGFYYCTIPSGQTAKGELIVTGGATFEVIVSPSRIKVRPRKYITVKCHSRRTDNGAPFGDAVFMFEDGTRVEARDRRYVQNSRGFGISEMIVAGGLETRDNNTRIYCKVGTKRRLVTIVIEDNCPPGHRRCRSGECVHGSKFCDGVHNCRDRSDEDPTQCNVCDPLTRKCEFHLDKAPLTPTFQVQWLCDGEDDCGNNFDESQCFGHYATCGGLRHTCRGHPGINIPRAYICDKENDCPFRDDEQGCLDPNIHAIRFDIRNKEVRLGDRVVLECEASGTPLPRIVWRFNWYCLPDNVRMTEHVEYDKCTKTKSRLTIDNFRPGDDGIYNCEAISAKKRSLSEDYIITVAPSWPWNL